MRLAVLGAGGHAKVVIATARSAGWTDLVCCDDDPARHGGHVLGVPIVGGMAAVLGDPGATAVIAVGDNRARRTLAEGAACQFATLIHASAVVDPSVALGDGTVVFAGCVIQPDVVVGAHAIINTGAAIDHDGRLGAFVHLGPGARLCGAVAIGEGTLVGIGAVAIPGVRIGAWATIGAGAAVVGNVSDRVTAVGVPAKSR